MFEQAVTSTKIFSIDSLTAADLDRLIFYAAEGADAKVCVVVDNHPLPVRDSMLEELGRMRDIVVLNNVFPDPKTTDIMAMVDSVRQLNLVKVPVVIGIGGGSAMDSAKGVAAVLSNGGDLDDYTGASPSRKIERRTAKLILIPTTAGTGSEVTRVGVYTSHSGRKYTLGHPLMQADMAVLVTDYTLTLPPSLTASTAFDALSHALETLWNRNATPLTDRLAVESAVHILQYMEQAYDSALHGGKAGRAEMMAGACMAGIAFSITGTAAVHALSFILSEEWHIPHGTACAFTLEDVYKLNAAGNEASCRKLAIIEDAFQLCRTEGCTPGEAVSKVFNCPDRRPLTFPQTLLEHLIALKRKFQLPFTFKDLNISLAENDIEKLFAKSLDDPKMKNNIIEMNTVKIIELIKHKL